MPPYIPPNARPPPSTPPSSSAWSSPAAANGRGRGRGGGGGSSIRPDGLKMARKEIGKKPGEMEMLASPSRGIEGSDEATLRNYQVQEKFRDHIQAKIVKLDAQFPSGRKECWPKRKEELSIILLDFRKLREGLTSSKRTDHFAAEVYETAIAYALEAQNYQQVGASLPFLVFELHPLLASSPAASSPLAEDELATSFSQISLGSTCPIYTLNEDKRALYQALHLLYLMVVLNEITSFRSTLTIFTSSSATATATTPPSSTSPSSTSSPSSAPIASPSTPPQPPLHPHLHFTQSIFLSLLSTNYIKLSRLISPPSSPSPSPSYYRPPTLLLSLLYSHLPSLREKTWQTLLKSYKMEKDFRDLDWLEKVLFFDLDLGERGEEGQGRKELKEFLKGKGKGVEEGSAWD